MTRTEFKVSVDRANKIINAILGEVAHFTYSTSEYGNMVFEYDSGDIAVSVMISPDGERVVSYNEYYHVSGDILRTIKVSPRDNTASYVKLVF